MFFAYSVHILHTYEYAAVAQIQGEWNAFAVADTFGLKLISVLKKKKCKYFLYKAQIWRGFCV